MKKSLPIFSIIVMLTLLGGAFLEGWFRPLEMVQASTAHPMVAAGIFHTVGLKSDGTVVAVGNNGYGQCEVGDWTNITQVAAGGWHTLGLKSDGTVLAVGNNDYGQCDVGDWTNITQVAAGGWHTVGLKSDGTALAVGYNGDGECNVGAWNGITQVTAGAWHTVGLKSDGTVLATGDNFFEQCDVGDWTDITQVAAGWSHTVGLESDGTVVAVGNNNHGQCEVGDWAGITQVAAGWFHTVGLKSDGTVVAVGNNNYGQCDVGDWTGVIQVAAGWSHTVGLKSDGTVVAVGNNAYGQCDVDGCDLGLTHGLVPPVVTTQPTDQTVTARETAAFSAVASGTPDPMVQWQVSNDEGSTWDEITGATSTTLTLTGVTLGQNGCQYRAVFTNIAGIATSYAATLTVSKIDTVTALNSSANPSLYGQSVTFTATVSPVTPGAGTPTGNVTFENEGTVLGNVTLNSAGQATYTVSTLSAGSHTITAVYSGDADFAGSSSNLTQDIRYNFSGFLSPLGKSTHKLGSSTPIKWHLTDVSGNFISDPRAVNSLMVGPVDGTLDDPTPIGGTALRYDSIANQYIFNWQTKWLSAGDYLIILSLADGTIHTTTVTLR
ncbi:MAG: hypothetical protein FJ012_08780 [Chloroflexi bacterium]|nr:hypothetical protein [Chloroflexota bacterium]